MLDLIWNLFQDSDIERLGADAARRAAQSSSEQTTIENRVSELERRYEELEFVTLALWRLLKERLNLSDTEIREYLESAGRRAP